MTLTKYFCILTDDICVVSIGTQQIAVNIGCLIGSNNIHLNSPVLSIEDHSSHVSVHTAGNTFTARKVIISLPSTMYRELSFTPALPQPLKTVADGTVLGNYNKAIVVYDTPWWRDLGFNGFFMSFEGGPLTLGRDTSVEEERFYALTLFVQGQPGYEWSKLPAHQRRSVVVKQLAAVYNQDVESECFKPIDYFDQIWKHEEYSRGALVPITEVGHLTMYSGYYGKPVGNLHFVGTEYASVWKGYMEGALDSGERGADEVVKALKKKDSRLAKL